MVPEEAEAVPIIFTRYLALGSIRGRGPGSKCTDPDEMIRDLLAPGGQVKCSRFAMPSAASRHSSAFFRYTSRVPIGDSAGFKISGLRGIEWVILGLKA